MPTSLPYIVTNNSAEGAFVITEVLTSTNGNVESHVCKLLYVSQICVLDVV